MSDKKIVPSIQEIVSYLDQYIIGQDYPKQVLANVVANRLLAQFHMNKKNTTKNVLLYGPSGSGKTLMVSKVAQFTDMQFIHTSAVNFDQKQFEHYANLIKPNQSTLILIDDIDLFCTAHEKPDQMLIAQKKLTDLLQGRFIPLKPNLLDNVIFVCAGTFSSGALNKLIPALQAQFCAQAMFSILDEFELLRILHEGTLIADYIQLANLRGISVAINNDALAALAHIAFYQNQKHQNIGINRLNFLIEELFRAIFIEQMDINLNGQFIHDYFSHYIVRENFSNYIL